MNNSEKEFVDVVVDFLNNCTEETVDNPEIAFILGNKAKFITENAMRMLQEAGTIPKLSYEAFATIIDAVDVRLRMNFILAGIQNILTSAVAVHNQ